MTPTTRGHRLTLPDGHAHLWWTRPSAFTASSELPRYRALLSDDEREKTDRYRFARDRHACLITRALARVTLSRYCDVAPEQWRFRPGAYGRPELAAPRSSLRFNLSHTLGLIVCLVSRDREVGVDVENLERERRWLDLAERFFAPREAAALRRVPLAHRPVRFLEYWTLKESYIKARGLGLAIPLDGFWFELPVASTEGVRVHLTSAVADDPARWCFRSERLGTSHLVATAVERHRGDSVLITRHEAVGPFVV